ncbi:MAG: hypothetical protein KatS3mg057_1656 [Herpetosiphonaceae bacterium]|nr:MAG: hypothetical protein KatS3mg057_1656 [Herpetosiphonaceae bacterium]
MKPTRTGSHGGAPSEDTTSRSTRGQDKEPQFGKIRFARARWWSGWVPPQVDAANKQVAGYWLMSTASGGPGDESVFVAQDEEIWRTSGPATPIPPTATPVPGTLTIALRQCTADGPSLAGNISAWTGHWESLNNYASDMTFSIPSQYSHVSYNVAVPANWTVASGELNDTVSVGTIVLIVLSDPAVCSRPSDGNTHAYDGHLR